MILTKIWERYFLKEFFKTAIFFITCFYGLYVLIDYANHRASFHHNHTPFQWQEVALYYLSEFVLRIEILLPFALLIATIRTLCALNQHHELIAMLSCGISLRTLLRPFLIVSLFVTGFVYINTEFFLPAAMNELKHIQEGRSRKKIKYQDMLAAQHIILEDGSTFLFQSYHTEENRFFDVYWIRNVNDIYRMKYLTVSAPPVGYSVDHLVRNSKNELATAESLPTHRFPHLKFNQKTLFETVTAPEELSLSSLWEKLPSDASKNEKDAQILATFYRKMIIPWFCLLAVLAIAPFCIRTSRNLPVFFIYAGSIFGLVALYLSLGAFVVLGKRQIIDPFLGIALPFLALTAYLGWRFTRMRQ